MNHASNITTLLRAHSLPVLNSATRLALHHEATRIASGEVGPVVHPQSGEVNRVMRILPNRESGEVGTAPVYADESGEVTTLFSCGIIFNATPETKQRTLSSRAPTFTYSHTVQALHTRFKATGRMINMQWVLLDSGATLHLFTNGKLLQNIRKAPNGDSITVNTSGGPVTTCLQGDLPGIGSVWYQPDGIANVLSLALVLMARSSLRWSKKGQIERARSRWYRSNGRNFNRGGSTDNQSFVSIDATMTHIKKNRTSLLHSK